MDPHRVISVAAAAVVAAEEKPDVASGQIVAMYEPNRPAKKPARPSAKPITNINPNPGPRRAATALAEVIVRDVAVPIPASSAPRRLLLARVEITITAPLPVINPFSFRGNRSPNIKSNRKVSLELRLPP